MLAEYGAFFGDPALIDKDLETYMAVSAEDIQKVATRIFNKEGATTIDVSPVAKEKVSTSK